MDFDGALWKRGRNTEYVVRKIQQAVDIVEKWSRSWGFRISIEKTKTMFFSKKKGN